MRYLLTLMLLAAGCTTALAREDSTRYLYPVRQVSGLYSANFGELRPGHFHGGVDIKTDGAVGKELVAVGDGYISRLSVAPGGYGRALYITLRDGHTAVYGHILRFRDDLEQRVDAERRRTRSNSVNLWFQPGEFPVAQGDVVARSGNSGSSFGPHLHFEIRETATQRTLNTVRMGIIRPKDHIAPLMLGLRYAEVDTLEGIPVHGPLRSFELKKTAEGRYRTEAGSIEVGPRGYFVIEASDRRDGVYNRFGLYRVSLYVDGRCCFEYRMDGFTFDRSRSCDAVSCYPLQVGARAEVIRLAQLEGAPPSSTPRCGSAAWSARHRARAATSVSRPKTTAATARRSSSTSAAARHASSPGAIRRPSPCGATATHCCASATRRHSASRPERFTNRSSPAPSGTTTPRPTPRVSRCSPPPTDFWSLQRRWPRP